MVFFIHEVDAESIFSATARKYATYTFHIAVVECGKVLGKWVGRSV